MVLAVLFFFGGVFKKNNVILKKLDRRQWQIKGILLWGIRGTFTTPH